jgi:hypothetical protein
VKVFASGVDTKAVEGVTAVRLRRDVDGPAVEEVVASVATGTTPIGETRSTGRPEPQLVAKASRATADAHHGGFVRSRYRHQ